MRTSIALTDCAIRGEADVLRIEDSRSIELVWEDGLVDVTGRLARVTRELATPEADDLIRLDLDHMTIAAGEGLFEMTDDVPVAELLPELVSALELPTTGPDGRPMNYRMDSKALGRELQDSETLAAAGVPDDDRYHIYEKAIQELEARYKAAAQASAEVPRQVILDPPVSAILHQVL